MTDQEIHTAAKRIAYRYRIPDMEYGDIVNEAVGFILENLNKGCDDKKAVSLARTSVRDLLRTSSRRDEKYADGDEFDAIDSQPDPSVIAENSELLEKIRGFLSDREFTVIELAFWNGADDQDIAEYLGCTLRAVRMTKHRALEKLRRNNLGGVSPIR